MPEAEPELVLRDSILGQATASTSDFASGQWNSPSDAATLVGSYDVITNDSPTVANSTGMTGDYVSNIFTSPPPLAPNGLQQNGGPTRTIELTSPVNGVAVVGITTDQRGVTRPSSPSIGSFQTVPPSVTSVSPTSGPTAGGTAVTITGTALDNATEVLFGSTVVNSSSFTSDSATQIVVDSPTGSAGTVDITVVTADGTSTTSTADHFTYVAAPTVTGISPTAGPAAGGTSVTITGTDFTGATAVDFNGVAATGVTVVSATEITATSPAGSPAIIDVTVTTVGGTSETSGADNFTYVAAPTVTHISPTAGPAAGGTSVTIRGTDFTGATAVDFNGVAATGVTVINATEITATSPAGSPATIDVTVTTVGGTSETSGADNFTYVAAPTVTGISPTAGPASGGTTVTITGTALTGATEVDFDGVAATGVTVVSATEITATSPGGSPATIDVTVTTVGGTSETSGADNFTYVAAPTVTGISPTAGPAAGGTSVTITGTAFTGATAVDFDGIAATGVTVVSDTEITATSPAGSPATIDVTVTTVGGTSETSGADNFTYVAAPTVTGISPTAGSTAGGTTVTITGTTLTGATEVDFNGIAATNVTVVSDTEITATSPAGSAAIVDVTVTTVGGTSETSGADNFTYVAPTLSVTPTSLALGSTTAGTASAEQPYSISGTYLQGNVTITAPSGVSLSDDGGVSWHSSLIETEDSGSLSSTTIEVELNSTTAATISSSITNATSAGTTQDVTLSGTITPAAATHLVITGLANDVAGTAQTITVEAEDPYGNQATAYSGTVHFTSTDSQATLPANYTFIGADDGEHTFTNAVTLKTAGSQTVTATDTVTSSITGTSPSVTITAAAASHLVITGLANDVAGTAQSITVEAEDPYGNQATAYTGTVTFTSTDSQATLPANYTFIGADNGEHTFTSGVTLKTVGPQTVTASDTDTPSITGTSSSGTITPAAASQLVITGLANHVAGTPQTIIVEAEDPYGNQATAYTGTIHFTSTDSQATLPANYTFIGADSGEHTFTTGVTLKTAGSQTVTATDTVTSSITGTSASVTITAAAASHLVITGPANDVAGTAQTVTVEAEDAYGNQATAYTGTVAFTSTDSQATLPANYTFIGADDGEHTFTSGVTLKTVGPQTVTATDTGTPSITGTSPSATITPAAATQLVITGLANHVAGTSQTITVEAEDPYGNQATAYTGTVTFTSTDSQAILPADYTFIGADDGEHTFTTGVSLKTAGSQTVTATDTDAPSITGTSPSVTITAAAATQLVITGLANHVAGTPQTITVEAEDPYGNQATAYTGTVHFTSTDSQATLPANYTFIGADDGEHTFTSGVTLKTAGSQTVTATDTVTSSITGTSASVTITAAAASHLVITGLANHAAGTAQSVTVEAEDAFGNQATSYTGTVAFTSTDSQATLPVNYTFIGADDGEHTFSVTIDTVGPQTVTATDTDTPSITGTSSSTTITPAAASQLVITGLANHVAGTSQTITVEAEDPYGNQATAYTGTVAFTSTDSQAILPANYTFIGADDGEHTFTTGVTLKTVGSQTVTATDTVTSSITGTSASVTITAAAASHLVITGLANDVAGTAQTITVEAEDPYGNQATAYTGTVAFTSTDSQATLPANYTFIGADNGEQTFTSGVTLKTVGPQTVTATDTVTSSITGTSPSVTITPAAASQLVITGLANHVAGTPQTIIVEAEDPYGNQATAYTGTVAFTSTDSQATLPANYTFIGADNGEQTFPSGVTLKTAGSQTVTASDTVTSSITGTSASVTITAAAASQLVITGLANHAAGTAQSITVEAEDPYGNQATAYTGTIHLASTDPQAILPANYTFIGADDGEHTFSVTIDTVGPQTVTATDTVTSSITGTSPSATITPAAASQLVITGLANHVAGTPQTITVEAEDPYGNQATAYTGTVAFTSTDSQATLPANYTFIGADNGEHTFTSGVTLETAGSQTVTATDTVTSSITGTSPSVTITAAAASHLVITGLANHAAGTAQSVTVEAEDAFGNQATSYTGTVAFTSTDSQATLPANYTFTNADAGEHTFSVTIDTVGPQTVTATDTDTPSITGTSLSATITPAAASQLIITGLANEVAGTPQTIVVEAEDPFGNQATAYTGTVHFTSTDSQATLPANYTFIGADDGEHTFTSGVTLKTAGSQTVTVTDTVTSSITGTSASVTITPAAFSQFAFNGLAGGTAGVAQSITIEAEDAYGNEVSTFTNTVDFSSTDPQLTGLPTSYAFTGPEATFPAVTFKTAGPQTITADDPTAFVSTTSPSTTITPAVFSQFAFNGLAGGTAGVAQSITIEAEDAYGNEVSSFTNTVDFSSTDPQLTGLPTSYTFTGPEATFPALTFKTAGPQTITADDPTASVSTISPSVTITPAVFSQLAFNGLGGGTAGVAQSITVEAEDAYGNEVSSFTNAVDFSSTDPQLTGLPTSYTFTSPETTFPAVTFRTAGSQTITADDPTASVSTTSPSVTITPAAAASFVVVSSGLPGVQVGVTVTAHDSYGNVATGYTGSLDFTTSDPNTILPTTNTLTNGVGTFDFTFDVTGTYTVTATDSESPSLTGDTSVNVFKQTTQAGEIVSSAPQVFYGQNIVFTATFSATGVANNAPMTGTVAFYDGNTFLGSATVSPISASFIQAAISPQVPPQTVSAQAVLPINALTPGSHNIRALFSGDRNYAAAESDTPVTINVQPATTSTTLSTSTTPQGTVLTASVVVTSPGNPPVVGTVSFYDGSTLLGTEAVINGVASLNIGVLTAGSHIFSATFSSGGTSSTSGASVTVSTDGPQVIGLSRLGFNQRPTLIVISFNQSLNTTSAQNPANYELYSATGHRYAIASVVYNPATLTVTVVPWRRLPVKGQFILEVVGTGLNAITNANGLALDGAGTGSPGSNFVTRFNWRALAAPNTSPAITYTNGQAEVHYQGGFTADYNAVYAATQYDLQHAVPRDQSGPVDNAKSKSLSKVHASTRIVLDRLTPAAKAKLLITPKSAFRRSLHHHSAH